MKKIRNLLIILFLIISCSDDDPIIQYTLTTRITPDNSGTISPSSGTYDDGIGISLTATTYSGYLFKEWSGSLTGNENPTTLLMNSDKTVTAIFDKIVYIPDNNFEQALIDLGYDDVLDDYVLKRNIENVKILDVGDKGITDLTGIQEFDSLTELWVNNPHTTDDNEKLTSLNISNNSELKIISVIYNIIDDLNISENINLTYLDVVKNPLRTLDITNNPNLEYLQATKTQLSSLNVFNNLNLEILIVSSNALSSLDVSMNPKLVTLQASFNNITSIDVSGSIHLESFSITYNALTCIQVNQDQLDNTPLGWFKTDDQFYSLDCDN